MRYRWKTNCVGRTARAAPSMGRKSCPVIAQRSRPRNAKTTEFKITTFSSRPDETPSGSDECSEPTRAWAMAENGAIAGRIVIRSAISCGVRFRSSTMKASGRAMEPKIHNDDMSLLRCLREAGKSQMRANKPKHTEVTWPGIDFVSEAIRSFVRRKAKSTAVRDHHCDSQGINDGRIVSGAELETLLCGAAGVTGGEGGRDGGIMKGGRQASLPPAMLVCICAPVCIRSCSMSWPVMPHAACDDAEAVVARAQPPKPVPVPVLGGIGNA